MDRQKLLMIFGGAFVAAALLTWFLYSQTIAPKKEKMATVVAATADLPAGTRLQKVHLKKVSIPASSVPRGAVLEDGLVLDRAILYPIAMNEPFLSTRLSSVTGADGVASLIEPGKRAVSISLADAASAGGLIQPRSHVDVLFTKTGSMAEAVTSTVLEDVIVLSIGRNVEAQTTPVAAPGSTTPAAVAPAPSTGNRSVTLLVTPEQARVVELAKNQGKISLSLRNPKDATRTNEVLSATSETIDPGLMLRTARARAMSGAKVSRAALNLPNLKDDQAWASLVGEEPKPRPPAPVKLVEKKEPPKPRAIVDVFRGDKHVQETFQE